MVHHIQLCKRKKHAIDLLHIQKPSFSGNSFLINHSGFSIPYKPQYIRTRNFACVGHPDLALLLENIFAGLDENSGQGILVLKERPNLILETSLLPEKDFPWPRQVVKRFKWRGFQGIISPFKKSKAMKSFHAAVHLIEHGLKTPMPLGAAEFRKLGFVINNVYITEAIHDFIDLRKYRDDLPHGSQGMEQVLRCLAAYVTRMHESGLWHRDLNLSNFMLTGQPGELTLYLVDLNRARIRTSLSLSQRAMDLSRLDLDHWQETFFKYYCADRFNTPKMLKIANMFRARRSTWRKMVVWTNPLRRKIGLK